MVVSADASAALAAQGRRLVFAPALEARFERDTGAERCRRLVRHNHVGLLIYNLFLAADWLLVRDVFAISLVLHLFVMTPIMFVVNGVIRRCPPARVREGMLSFGITLTTAAIICVMLLSRSPLRTSEHHSVVLVILFATMIQRIRFPYVIFACAASYLLYALALALSAQEPPRMMVAAAVLACVILFSLIGSYNLEHEQRISYLLGLRDRLRNEELEEISRRDPLTGVGNRRALDAAARLGSGEARLTAVLLCDIDFFKSFNDLNGHLAGDQCLVRVAGLIGESVRGRTDQVYRFGGEEFIATLDVASAADAIIVAERIRSSVEGAAISRSPGGGVVTISVGVACARGLTLDELIARADCALYEAKRNGRNQVNVFTAPEAIALAPLPRSDPRAA